VVRGRSARSTAERRRVAPRRVGVEAAPLRLSFDERPLDLLAQRGDLVGGQHTAQHGEPVALDAGRRHTAVQDREVLATRRITGSSSSPAARGAS
jgi:hypothetical protein